MGAGLGLSSRLILLVLHIAPQAPEPVEEEAAGEEAPAANPAG
jgi:hypothetical protein